MEYDKVEATEVKKEVTNDAKTVQAPMVKEQKPAQAVVVQKGKVKQNKKGLLERLVIGMLGPNGLPAIGSYLGKEVVLPAIKNIIVDSVTSGVNMAMFGDGTKPGGTGYASRNPVTHQTNYANRYASTSQTPGAPTKYSTPTSPRPINPRVIEYIIPSREEALLVLQNLRESAELYGSVAVADYYDAIGVESSYTDNSYGWDAADLVGQATIVGTRNGFVIKFPSVRVL